ALRPLLPVALSLLWVALPQHVLREVLGRGGDRSARPFLPLAVFARLWLLVRAAARRSAEKGRTPALFAHAPKRGRLFPLCRLGRGRLHGSLPLSRAHAAAFGPDGPGGAPPAAGHRGALGGGRLPVQLWPLFGAGKPARHPAR